MKLDFGKLEHLKKRGNNGWVARCPACAEAGGDSQGQHLRIYSDGRYGCVVNAGKDGHEHRSRILALVGIVRVPNINFSVKIRPQQTTVVRSVKESLLLGFTNTAKNWH